VISRLSRRSALKLSLGLATTVALRSSASGVASELASAGRLAFAGINLASAEFGESVPGRHGIDYMYPTAEHVDRFATLGFNCFRVPFRWERLQPALFAEIDQDECKRLVTLVGEITARGLFAVIDPHNYARRRLGTDGWSREHVIGSAEVSTDSFADFWQRLASLFAADERVVLGLMNEPHGLSAADWLAIANRAIAAIRGCGAGNLLLVPGTAYTGAHSWLGSGNGVMSGVVDPLDHFAIEVHQYFDANSSGTSSEVVSGSCGTERLSEFQAWARERGLKAFLGEFGAAGSEVGRNALADICQEMSSNPDVWLGWTAWAAGPFWPDDYVFNLEPLDGRQREQTKVLATYARSDDADVWVKPGAVIDLDLARERCHGCASFADALAFSSPRSARTAQPGMMELRGPLLALLREPAFSLIVEVEGLDRSIQRVDLIDSDLGVLLARSHDGALYSPLASGLTCAPIEPMAWRQRRRCALSVDRPQSMVAVAVSGARSARRAGTAPRAEGLVVSAGSNGGRVVRITGYGHFLDGRAIDTLLA
jgi:endoglucanase